MMTTEKLGITTSASAGWRLKFCVPTTTTTRQKLVLDGRSMFLLVLLRALASGRSFKISQSSFFFLVAKHGPRGFNCSPFLYLPFPFLSIPSLSFPFLPLPFLSFPFLSFRLLSFPFLPFLSRSFPPLFPFTFIFCSLLKALGRVKATMICRRIQ